MVKQASYELSVNGTGGLQFSEKSYIQFREKGFSIYIQTDKGIYKPGQTGEYLNYILQSMLETVYIKLKCS